MGKNLKKTIYTSDKITEVTDVVTGEVTQTITEKQSTYIQPREPAFFKMFVNDLSLLFGLNDVETKCMYEFASKMSYSNVIPLVGPMREIIRESLQLTPRTFERSIKELKERGILIPMLNKENKPMRGMYVLNPNIAAKGAWNDIQKLRMSIEYVDNKRYVSCQAVGTDESVFSLPPIEVIR